MSKFFGAGASHGEFFTPQQRPTVCCEERWVKVVANLAPWGDGEVEDQVFYQWWFGIECDCHNGDECPPNEEGPLVRDDNNTTFNWSEKKYKFCCRGCATEEPEPDVVVVGDILGEREGPCTCDGWTLMSVSQQENQPFVSLGEVRTHMKSIAQTAFDDMSGSHPDSLCIGCEG